MDLCISSAKQSHLLANCMFMMTLSLKSLASEKNFPFTVWTWPGLCTGALPLNPTRPNRGLNLWFFKKLSRWSTKIGRRWTTCFMPGPSLLTNTTSTSLDGSSFQVEFFLNTRPLTSHDAVDYKKEKSNNWIFYEDNGFSTTLKLFQTNKQ